MNTNDEEEEETEIKREEPVAKKWKRVKEMEAEVVLGQGPEVSAIPLSPIHP